MIQKVNKTLCGIVFLSGNDWRCLKNKDVIIGKHQEFESNGSLKTCYTSCHDQTFKLQTSNSKYPSLTIFKNSIEFCYILKKILRSCNNFKRRSLEIFYPGICNEFQKYQLLNFTCDSLSYKYFKVRTH